MCQSSGTNPNRMAIASLCLGIIGILSVFTPIHIIVGIICAIIGLILGRDARRLLPPAERALATTGWICSIIALSFIGIFLLIILGFFGFLVSIGLLV